MLALLAQLLSLLFWVQAWECNCSGVDSILALVTQWHSRPFWGNRSEFSGSGVELSAFFNAAVIFNLLTEPLHIEFSHLHSHKHKQVNMNKKRLTHCRHALWSVSAKQMFVYRNIVNKRVCSEMTRGCCVCEVLKIDRLTHTLAKVYMCAPVVRM